MFRIFFQEFFQIKFLINSAVGYITQYDFTLSKYQTTMRNFFAFLCLYRLSCRLSLYINIYLRKWIISCISSYFLYFLHVRPSLVLIVLPQSTYFFPMWLLYIVSCSHVDTYNSFIHFVFLFFFFKWIMHLFNGIYCNFCIVVCFLMIPESMRKNYKSLL